MIKHLITALALSTSFYANNVELLQQLKATKNRSIVNKAHDIRAEEKKGGLEYFLDKARKYLENRKNALTTGDTEYNFKNAMYDAKKLQSEDVNLDEILSISKTYGFPLESNIKIPMREIHLMGNYFRNIDKIGDKEPDQAKEVTLQLEYHDEFTKNVKNYTDNIVKKVIQETFNANEQFNFIPNGQSTITKKQAQDLFATNHFYRRQLNVFAKEDYMFITDEEKFAMNNGESTTDCDDGTFDFGMLFSEGISGLGVRPVNSIAIKAMMQRPFEKIFHLAQYVPLVKDTSGLSEKDIVGFVINDTVNNPDYRSPLGRGKTKGEQFKFFRDITKAEYDAMFKGLSNDNRSISGQVIENTIHDYDDLIIQYATSISASGYLPGVQLEFLKTVQASMSELGFENDDHKSFYFGLKEMNLYAAIGKGALLYLDDTDRQMDRLGLILLNNSIIALNNKYGELQNNSLYPAHRLEVDTKFTSMNEELKKLKSMYCQHSIECKSRN